MRKRRFAFSVSFAVASLFGSESLRGSMKKAPVGPHRKMVHAGAQTGRRNGGRDDVAAPVQGSSRNESSFRASSTEYARDGSVQTRKREKAWFPWLIGQLRVPATCG